MWSRLVGNVLWLAHRHELLSQAGAEFHKLAALAHPRERLRVRIVSGAHCAMTQVDPADDIVIASVASLARRPEIAQMLIHDEERMIVMDEAHHAPARSYRDLIEALQARQIWRVLGLTATPTRTLEQQRPILARLFGRRILYQVGLHELIERRILARPIPVIVPTGADVEADVTDDDRAHYERFGELSEEWLDRIASYVERNGLIVQHYLAERRKYGPTRIFAINVRHAALLADDLRECGVRADYVASYRPDGSDGELMTVIRQFRDGQLDVLVNVQIMTEGVDIPGIQTVFLTQPTTSEILMRQMIGRALRGPAVDGSEHAYLVSFKDHWEKFRDWDSPFDLVPDIEAVADREAPEAGAVADVNRFQEYLPWDVIRATAMALRATSVEHKADAFEAAPDGWLVLERDDEDEGVRAPIAIYQHQRPCWDALVAHLRSVHGDALKGAHVEVLYEEFFADCDVPAPSPHLVGMLGLPTLEFPGTLTWSHRLLKGWYGMAYYRETPPRIRINRLLDSPDISVTTMQFLIWHEFLHVHLASGHTQTFREHERRWPGCVGAERELDNLNETFGVQYW
jgi:superfamily II DNA or RNA helicase